ncbi:sugar ABC transporter substrate-binding protein [Beijerinckia indica]|uniref:ABC transporter sugar-binding protein n=1 Tax=Beijerinckia indica subsp. indica (strain ATCC 9039 / DSM 1715 / NCIMB 8712) TaxID=395963 RepID=B2IBL8_BEII9|nr:sugar ABC transporter substrate-binding protein [Beijerinckia indica]ACB96644.1 ABC transporter sugar-binding protein [Beijerinckia indica subsp. indica ATCC 9039]
MLLKALLLVSFIAGALLATDARAAADLVIGISQIDLESGGRATETSVSAQKRIITLKIADTSSAAESVSGADPLPL